MGLLWSSVQVAVACAGEELHAVEQASLWREKGRRTRNIGHVLSLAVVAQGRRIETVLLVEKQ